VDPLAQSVLDGWFAALELRHAGALSFRELRRGLQGLSSVYVERRGSLTQGAALRGAGKRAAFALFYGPLHFVLTARVVRELGAGLAAPDRILDLGCGTGAAGAAWALEASGGTTLSGVDLHPWAVAETRWTWKHFGLRGSARRDRLERVRLAGRRVGLLLAFSLNELARAERAELRDRLLASAAAGSRVLILEPIARRAAPWWGEWARQFRDSGGRADEWRFAAELPQGWRELDRAAGLDHRLLTARSIYLDGSAA
jgi:hypothetical protein